MEPVQIPFESDHFTVHQLTDGVFAAIASTGGSAISNAGIIDLGERTLIFDTFMTPQAATDLRVAAQQLTGRDPELIVNSHYHNDHIWGNQVFSPAAVFLSTSQTLRLMHTSGLQEVQWAQDVSAKRLENAMRQHATAQDEHARQDSLLWVGYFGGLVEALPSLSIRFPEITFEDRLAIHGTSRSVELIAFEDSHTANDTILYLREAGIIFTADLLFIDCHPYLDECDISKLRSSLEQVSGMDAAVFVPGHGPVGARRDIGTNLDYIAMCADTARELIAKGDTSETAIARVKQPSNYAHWTLSRFFTANLESLCSKMASEQAES
jgi:cyclase